MAKVLYIAYDVKDNEQVRYIGTPEETMKEFGLTKRSLHTMVSVGKLVKRRYLIKSFEVRQERKRKTNRRKKVKNERNYN